VGELIVVRLVIKFPKVRNVPTPPDSSESRAAADSEHLTSVGVSLGEAVAVGATVNQRCTGTNALLA
jgi:hypothetical protein